MTKMRSAVRCALLCLLALPLAGGARGLPVDGYAAVVNQRVITAGEVLALIQPAREQIEATFKDEELRAKIEEAYQAGLDALIERALILEEFAKQGGQIPDRLVDAQVNDMIAERFHNDRAAFLEALADERMTLDEWREETRNRLIVMIMRRREVIEKAVVVPRKIREAYESRQEQYHVPEQVRLRLIVLQKGKTPQDEAAKRTEAERILARIQAGEDFGELAKTSSEGAKAAEGGDLGWVDPRTLRAELKQAVEKMQPGQTGGVIALGDEFYILKLEGRKNPSVVAFDDVRGQIEEQLRRAEEERLYRAWIERLKRKYYVKIFPRQD